MKTLLCKIERASEQYPIEIKSNMLEDPQYLHDSLKKIARNYVIISHTDFPYANRLYQHLKGLGLNIFHFNFPCGEKFKNRQTKESIEDFLLSKNLGKDICLIACGGGVVTDIVGFTAATYYRGIPLIHFPTSLLAMVDASIGGKVSVNVKEGKNLLGTIYQPKKVIIDPLSLRTLPLKEIKNGVAEMIKHALIFDSTYFDYLEKNAEAILNLEQEEIETAIYESCKIKIAIVQEDEHDSGKRRLLNFGHTIGHAIETASDFKIAHGEAVALGIIIESFIAYKNGYLKYECMEKIVNIFKRYHFPLSTHDISYDILQQAMTRDKKSVQGQPRIVMLKEIGIAEQFAGKFVTAVDQQCVKQALNWFQHDLCCY